MIVPFWLAYILARRGIHNLRPAVAHILSRDKDKMGMCLCREKDPTNRDVDSRNVPSGSPNVAAIDPSFREFYSQGRQWRLGVGEGRMPRTHNGRSLAQSTQHKKHQSGKSIDSLVLETLALIRTLVDK